MAAPVEKVADPWRLSEAMAVWSEARVEVVLLGEWVKLAARMRGKGSWLREDVGGWLGGRWACDR